MNTTTLAHAVANAEPLAKPNIRLATFSQHSKIISVYFTDKSLIGRRFNLTIERYALKIVEAEPGAAKSSTVRNMGKATENTVGLTFSVITQGGAKLYDDPWKEYVSVAPTWEGGRLIYDVLTSAEANVGAKPAERRNTTTPSKDQPPATRMPRPETLRALLNDLRQLEKTTPYRLERDTDGKLQFVARIV